MTFRLINIFNGIMRAGAYTFLTAITTFRIVNVNMPMMTNLKFT
ncbi:MAG: hypothetical protein WBW94_00745 [Anaerolineales bacterium]